MRSQSSEDLMRLYQTGDERAFDELHRRHRYQVVGLCKRLVAPHHHELLPLVPDIVQEVFTYLHAHRDAYTPGRFFQPFLWTIAKRVTLNYLDYECSRCRDYRRRLPSSAAKMCEPDPLIAQRDKEAVQSAIEQGIQTLCENQKQVIRLVYFGNLTSKQVAATMGVPVSTVNWWRREALAAMKMTMPDAEAVFA